MLRHCAVSRTIHFPMSRMPNVTINKNEIMFLGPESVQVSYFFSFLFMHFEFKVNSILHWT